MQQLSFSDRFHSRAAERRTDVFKYVAVMTLDFVNDSLLQRKFFPVMKNHLTFLRFIYLFNCLKVKMFGSLRRNWLWGFGKNLMADWLTMAYTMIRWPSVANFAEATCWPRSTAVPAQRWPIERRLKWLKTPVPLSASSSVGTFNLASIFLLLDDGRKTNCETLELDFRCRFTSRARSLPLLQLPPPHLPSFLPVLSVTKYVAASFRLYLSDDKVYVLQSAATLLLQNVEMGSRHAAHSIYSS